MLDNCCPVWHCGLSKGQSSDIEAVRKLALRTVLPHLCYDDALVCSGLEKLSARRVKLSRKAFVHIKSESHVLNHLLVRRTFDRNVVTRDAYPYCLPMSRTGRALKSIISYGIRNRF